MSSLTTTSVITANNQTNLTLRTGNAFGPSVVIGQNNGVVLRANTTANVVTINTTSVSTNLPIISNNNLTVTGQTSLNTVSINNISITNSLTVNNTVSVDNTISTRTLSSNNIVSNNATFNANVVANNMTVSSMNVGTSSISANGFSRLPNGLLLQWGSVAATTANTTVTFSTPFSVAPYSFQGTPLNASATNAIFVVRSINSTAAVVRCSTNVTVTYIVLGV
jgi:hypothetical protein